jgi:histidine triad (HIT) family protein
VHEGHVLVLPKKHVVNLEDVSEKLLNKTIKIVKKFGQSIKDNLAPGYNIIVNNDPVAGQEIQHLHFHVIPRYDKDRLTTWTRNQYGEGRVELIQKQLKIN